MTKEWALILNKKNCVLLHLVEDFEQYEKCKRVNKKDLVKLIKCAKTPRQLKEQNKNE